MTCIFPKTREAVLKVAQYYVNKFNEIHSTKAELKEERKKDGSGFDTAELVPDGKINIFISSKGVLADEDVETITDETEPMLPEGR